MQAYCLLLEERVRITKAVALISPTAAHLTAHGHAILDLWDADTPLPIDAATPVD